MNHWLYINFKGELKNKVKIVIHYEVEKYYYCLFSNGIKRFLSFLENI